MEEPTPTEATGAAGNNAQNAPTPLKSTPVIWIATFACCLFGLGMYDFLIEKEPNQCAMSYMYEYPQYIQLELDNPRSYGLYAYGEGKLSEFLKEGKYDGIPVLFIPGNAGSHRQVRSMASVALRKAIEESKYKLHFDYFAVDFNEEFSAIYGGELESQADFVIRSISKILSLYEGGTRSSVVLIGHSVGGLVAKSLFLNADFKADSVHTIITLATPHAAPVVNFDPYLNDFYARSDQYWNLERNKTLSHVSLISVGGGGKDIQVHPALTKSDHADVNVQTTAAPGVWVSADHRCIVWCKQLVLSLNRALFDLIDTENNNLITDKAKRDTVFKYHLLHRSAGKRFREDLHPPRPKFDREAEWRDINARQHTYMEKEVEKNTYLMVKTVDDPKHKRIAIDAVNMDNDNWVFVCNATSVHKGVRMCENGINLSAKSYIVPSNGKRKTVVIDMDHKAFTHVVIYMYKGMKNVRLTWDVHNPEQRVLEPKLPKWISFWSETRVVKLTPQDIMYYTINLKELDSPWQSYEISATPLRCSEGIQEN